MQNQPLVNIFRTLGILLPLLFVLGGCATLGKTDIHIANSGKKIEYLLLENNASKATVVFENGLAGKMDWWSKVTPAISKDATIFAYNRAGYGDSDVVDTPRDGEHIVVELRKLLAAKGLRPPYILVEHSVGGLYMQYFARRYPDEVSALILVDSTHPKQFIGDGSTDNWPFWFHFLFGLTLNDTQEKEFELINKTGADVLALPTFEKKVIVVSASKPMSDKSKLSDYANMLRKDLAALYPNSKQIWADSGHAIPFEKPEVVIDAIGDAVK